MSKVHPVSLPEGAFAFCRSTIAVLFWVALIFRTSWIVLVGFLILFTSGILGVEHAPLIRLWMITFEKLRPTKPQIVDANGIRFSHYVGACMAGIAMVLFLFRLNLAAWIVVVILAILQTSAAFGFCSALKLYQCMNSGTCCRVGKVVRKIKHV